MSKANKKVSKTTINGNYINISIEDLDLKKITFSELRKNKYKGNYFNIYYDGKIPQVKFPKMKAPFGISRFEDPNNNSKVNYGLETSLDEKLDNSELTDVYKKCVEFDNFIINNVKKNWKTFEYDDEEPEMKQLKKMYTHMVRPSLGKDKKPTDYSSRIKSSLNPTKEGVFPISCYDEDKNKIELNTDNYNQIVGQSDEVSTVKLLRQLWFMSNGGFGTSWDIRQMRVYKNQNNLTDSVLFDTDDEKDSGEDSESESAKGSEISDEE